MKHSTFVKLLNLTEGFNASSCEKCPVATLLHEETGRPISLGCNLDFRNYCLAKDLNFDKLYNNYKKELFSKHRKNLGCFANVHIVKNHLLNINHKLDIE